VNVSRKPLSDADWGIAYALHTVLVVLGGMRSVTAAQLMEFAGHLGARHTLRALQTRLAYLSKRGDMPWIVTSTRPNAYGVLGLSPDSLRMREEALNAPLDHSSPVEELLLAARGEM